MTDPNIPDEVLDAMVHAWFGTPVDESWSTPTERAGMRDVIAAAERLGWRFVREAAGKGEGDGAD